MFRKSWAISSSLALAVSLAAAADGPQAQAKLSAAEIAAKNVTARGGADAWRAVKTMSWTGKMGAGGNVRATLSTPEPPPGSKMAAREKTGKGVPSVSSVAASTRLKEEAQLPFRMEMERPRKSRLELQFAGQTAVQVYDGTNGWKLRPYLNRRVVEPFTDEELKKASQQADLDPLLVDYAAKGTQIELAGMEKVEERDNYKLKLTMKTGIAIHVWVDALTFLETKMEGQPRRLDGTDHPVEVYTRDFRPVSGLQIPYVLETRVLPVARTAMGLRDPAVPPEKILIETVVVNPKLDESRFGKPDPNTK